MTKCYQCERQIGDCCYKVMVITKEGKQEFVKTCCEDCAKDLRHDNFALHQRRANDVINCSIQKMNNE